MNDFSLDSEMSIEVTARFIKKGSDAPLTGAEYELRLFDKDLFEDDYLGKSWLDENGVAKISFRHDSFSDKLNIEQQPDFYFALYKGSELIFTSKVLDEFNLEASEQFKMGEGEVVDLGTFLVTG